SSRDARSSGSAPRGSRTTRRRRMPRDSVSSIRSWNDEFERVAVRVRDLQEIAVERAVLRAVAFDRHLLADGLREVRAADADAPEPRGRIALELPRDFTR